jgi:hypothetical protein
MRRAVLLLLTLFPAAVMAAPPPVPSPARIDAEAKRLMQVAHARGMAVAVVDGGKVVHVATYGERNAAGEPLQTDTVMYAASLTKMAFGHLIAQLAQDKVIDLDASIASALDRPLPDYPAEPKKYADYTVLAGDERWRRLTPRLLLNHASGFANFAFLEPDGKLKFHFDPGSRYGYSGEGLILLQFVLAPVQPYSMLWFIYLLPVFFLAGRLFRDVPAPLVFLAAALLETARIQTGWSLVDLGDAGTGPFVRLVTTQADPLGVFWLGLEDLAFVPLDSGAPGSTPDTPDVRVHRLQVVDHARASVRDLPLPSPPETIGALDALERLFITQTHPEGRISFLSLERSDAPLETLSGYLLNGGIE